MDLIFFILAAVVSVIALFGLGPLLLVYVEKRRGARFSKRSRRQVFGWYSLMLAVFAFGGAWFAWKFQTAERLTPEEVAADAFVVMAITFLPFTFGLFSWSAALMTVSKEGEFYPVRTRNMAVTAKILAWFKLLGLLGLWVVLFLG